MASWSAKQLGMACSTSPWPRIKLTIYCLAQEMTSVYLLQHLKTRNLRHFICPLTIPRPNMDPLSWPDLITLQKDVNWHFLDLLCSISNTLILIISLFTFSWPVCVRFCGLSASASSVPRVARCQHSVTKALPVAPTTQAHTSRKVMRGREFKNQRTHSHFLSFIFSLIHTQSLTLIVRPLCSYAKNTQMCANMAESSELESGVLGCIPDQNCLGQSFQRRAHVNYNHRAWGGHQSCVSSSL